MTQKNNFKTSKEHFDLDDYIEEKANSDNTNEYLNHEPKKEKSSFLRNAALLFGFGILTLLYFNNWSPMQVYGNIFGIEKYQAGYVPPVVVAPEPLVIEVNPAGGAQLVDLKELEKLAELEALESLKGLESLEELRDLESLGNLEELESSLAGLENMEDMNELREFALSTAMQALEGIGNSPEFGEVIGEASQLGIQEALKELQNIRNLEINEAERLADAARNVNLSFIEYSTELEKIGLDDMFNNSSLQKLHEADIPSSFLKQLDEQGLLENLTIDGVIKAFKEEGQ